MLSWPLRSNVVGDINVVALGAYVMLLDDVAYHRTFSFRDADLQVQYPFGSSHALNILLLYSQHGRVGLLFHTRDGSSSRGPLRSTPYTFDLSSSMEHSGRKQLNSNEARSLEDDSVMAFVGRLA
jgi:hypothetical protein